MLQYQIEPNLEHISVFFTNTDKYKLVDNRIVWHFWMTKQKQKKSPIFCSILPNFIRYSIKFTALEQHTYFLKQLTANKFLQYRWVPYNIIQFYSMRTEICILKLLFLKNGWKNFPTWTFLYKSFSWNKIFQELILNPVTMLQKKI